MGVGVCDTIIANALSSMPVGVMLGVSVWVGVGVCVAGTVGVVVTVTVTVAVATLAPRINLIPSSNASPIPDAIISHAPQPILR